MTNLEIINRALGLIGALPASSMADTASSAAKAITAYPLCRDEMLRLIPWPSCVTRALMKNMADQACPWAASYAYEVGDQVTNDTNKTYRCSVAGTSASSGGPTGTSTGITDGTVTWNYVQASTKANNWAHWVSTAYVVGDLITSDKEKVYYCITSGTTGASSPPSGVTHDITDGTAHWCWYATSPRNRTAYAYQYVIPLDCLRILKVPLYGAAKESDQGVQYQREGNFLFCDQDDSHLRYIKREEDPTNWNALLQSVVAPRIATEIVFGITGQAALTNKLYQEFAMMASNARVVALNEGAESTPEPVLWEEA